MSHFNRRQLLRGATGLGAAAGVSSLFPSWARGASLGLAPALPTLSGADIKLAIGHSAIDVDGRMGHAVTINGTVPGPLIRLTQGQRVRFAVA